MYREAIGNVFRIETNAIAHCITADYSLGAGLAKDLDEKYNLKSQLMNMGTGVCPDCLLIKEDDLTIFNLVTKTNRYDKATYENLEEALVNMKQQMIDENIETVYVPQLGCGKDRLNWDMVKSILKKLFDKDKEHHVCVLFYVAPKK